MRHGVLAAAAAAAATLLAQPAAAAIVGFNYTACAPAGMEDPTLASNDEAYVCLSFNGRTTSVFKTRVDQFSALQIAGSNYALPPGSGLLQKGYGWVDNATAATLNCSDLTGYGQDYYWTFDIGAHAVFSPYPRLYKKVTYNPCTGAASVIQTVPLYTVIIGVDKGKLSYIAWDDGCFFCTESGTDCVHTAIDLNGTSEVDDSNLRGCREALDTNQNPPQDDCYPTSSIVYSNVTDESGNVTTVGTNVTTPCDLKVFVSWIGTDRNGKFLRSAGQRFSRYRAFGAANLYQGALNLGNEALNIANSAIDQVSGIPGRIAPGGGGGRRLWRAPAAAGGAAAQAPTVVRPAAGEAEVRAGA